MKNDGFAAFLKIAAICGFILAAYPIIMFTGLFFGREDNLLRTALLLASAMAGYGLRLALFRHEIHREVLFKLCYGLTLAAPFAAGMAFSGEKTADRVIFSLLLTAAYGAGMVFVCTDYRMIYTPLCLAVEITAYVLTLISATIAEWEAPMTECTAVFLADFTLYLIICNQGHIDALMERRHSGSENLPAKIRGYNLRTVLFISALIAATALLRKNAAELLRNIIRLILVPVELFFRLINYLSTLFSTEAAEQTEEQGAAVMPESAGGEDYSVFIISALFIAAVIILIVRGRHSIADFFRKIYRAVVRFILMLLNIKVPENVSADGYYDVEEELDHHTEGHDGKRAAMRKWRGRLRKYFAMPEGEEKLRCGYALMAEGLDFDMAKTPLENAADNTAECVKSAKAYSALRYGNGCGDVSAEIKNQTELLKRISVQK